MEAILASPSNRVNGFLGAGHVCAIMGQSEYEPIAAKFRVPIVVTGFEPLDILEGVHLCVQQLEQGRAKVENQYARSVRAEGNLPAQKMIREIFRVAPRRWRGIGDIPRSGLALAEKYERFDAERKFGPAPVGAPEAASECIAGLILQGAKKPSDCPAFGTRCLPEKPLGAPMVSSEGACAAYYKHRRLVS
jgi:hydrogenase expression/formation protein HypD